MPPWSSGLGRRPLTAVTGVRIPLEVPLDKPLLSVSTKEAFCVSFINSIKVIFYIKCENQKFNDTFVDSERVHVDTLSTELQKVRDYVPQ